MAAERHFTYPSADGITQIHAIEWKPEGPVKGILQIAHGMQEFIDRYASFASFLCDQGFLVVGNDHLGHGASVASEDRYSYFAEQNGNRAVIADMRELHRRTQEAWPGLPFFLLGHSMGSFLARQYICLYGQFLDGAIISGTAYFPEAKLNGAMIMCRLIALFKGWKYPSPLMTALSMGSFNKKFEPARTRVDWLTRDEQIVDAYRHDSRTHHMFTLNAWYNMFTGLKYLNVRANLEKMPKTLPVLFIAGQMDPVGDFGTGVKKVYAQIKGLGMKDVTCKLYPNDRHEVLNELDRQQVWQDVRDWLAAHMET